MQSENKNIKHSLLHQLLNSPEMQSPKTLPTDESKHQFVPISEQVSNSTSIAVSPEHSEIEKAAHEIEKREREIEKRERERLIGINHLFCSNRSRSYSYPPDKGQDTSHIDLYTHRT